MWLRPQQSNLQQLPVTSQCDLESDSGKLTDVTSQQIHLTKLTEITRDQMQRNPYFAMEVSFG